MIKYIVAVFGLLAIAFILFSPWLKGFRTQIAGWATVIGGAALPLATQIVGYLQTLDWRQYVLSADKNNLYVLAIVGGLGILMVVLRFMTTGPVGSRK